MNYMPSTEFQLEGFAYSILLGVLLGVFYDALRLIFYLVTLRKRKYTNARDVVFFVLSLFATFIYLLVMCEGQVLFYAISGELIGFALHRFTLAKFIFNSIFKKLPQPKSKSTLKNKNKQKRIEKISEILKKLQKKT